MERMVCGGFKERCLSLQVSALLKALPIDWRTWDGEDVAELLSVLLLWPECRMDPAIIGRLLASLLSSSGRTLLPAEASAAIRYLWMDGGGWSSEVVGKVRRTDPLTPRLGSYDTTKAHGTPLDRQTRFRTRALNRL
jgi:hypothetical protein